MIPIIHHGDVMSDWSQWESQISLWSLPWVTTIVNSVRFRTIQETGSVHAWVFIEVRIHAHCRWDHYLRRDSGLYEKKKLSCAVLSFFSASWQWEQCDVFLKVLMPCLSHHKWWAVLLSCEPKYPKSCFWRLFYNSYKKSDKYTLWREEMI